MTTPDRPPVLVRLRSAGRRLLRVDVVVLVLVELLVLRSLAPSRVLTDVLPLGGDHSGHSYLIHETGKNLAHLRLGGWADGWLAGLPTGTLYPVLGPAFAALLSVLVPLAVAYKLAIVVGPLLLPLAAYAAARWSRLPRPLPLMLAVICAPFLLDVSCNLCGGTIDSDLTGEYDFSLALALGLLALGALAALLDDRAPRWAVALLLGFAFLGHPVPALWVGASVVVLLVHGAFTNRAATLHALPAVGLSALIALTWWGPFLHYRSYTPRPLFLKVTAYGYQLFPFSGWWDVVIVGLALAGAVFAVRLRHRFLIALGASAVIAVLAFLALPESQLPNERVLPFFQLGEWLLVGLALVELSAIAARKADGWRPSLRLVQRMPTAGPVAVLVVVVFLQGIPWGTLPGETYKPSADPAAAGTMRWLGITWPAVGQSQYAHDVFGGARRPEDPPGAYDDFVAMIADVMKTHGCGRLARDHDDSFPKPDRMPSFVYYNIDHQLPLITHGCITSVLGTTYDSSQNTPEVLIDTAVSSDRALTVMPHLPYPRYSFDIGMKRLRLLGVRYYLTYGGQAATDAAASSEVTEVAHTGTVQLWELNDAAVVAPLTNQPVVVTGVPSSTWQAYYVSYALTDAWGDVVVTADGPSAWPRISAGTVPDNAPLASDTVSDVQETDGRVSFDVSTTGVPVVVRETYFPGWHVSGADAVYRATPDFMVVVPTSKHVVLTYGQTTSTVVFHAIGLLGVLGSVALGVLDRRRRRRPAAAPVPKAGARRR